MGLGLRLFKDDELPLYVQVADAVRARIVDGELREGDKLPSVRKLSDELGVNPATIVAAYRILATEGLIASRAGSGVFVCGMAAPGATTHVGRHEGTPRPAGRMVDLAANAPPRCLYPLEDVKRFLVEAVDMDDGGVFDYQDSAGYLPLREAIATRLGLGRSRPADPADVHIVSGAQQGLDLVARVLLRRGDVAAVESPGYRGARDSFLAAGARIEAIPVGAGGIDVDALERIAAARPLRLVYLNPGYQNPTGAVYLPEVRERLARMAARHSFYIVEDDQSSELSFDGICQPSVRSFDHDDRVLYVKSFSKVLMPGLRIACLEAPAAFRDRLETAKRSIDLSSNGLMQRVLERFLSSGSYDAHLPIVRARYSEAAMLLTTALEPYRGAGLTWSQPSGGINLWLALPPGSYGVAVAAGCAERGYSVAPEAGFRHETGQVSDAHVRVSFGSVALDVLGPAARALGDSIIESAQRLSESPSNGRS
ncbi:MAG TPA: PLP-dependent aminotransferase family protein [bacterium]|nr:PLP-dependent aminotransferase family protein [bacterium]